MSSYCTSIIYAGSTEGLMYLADKIAYPPLWETYRKDFDTLGTRGLFNIGDISEITPELIEKAHKIVEYYVGSLENINEEHLHGIALMFTDSGFQYGNILLGLSRCVMKCHGVSWSVTEHHGVSRIVTVSDFQYCFIIHSRYP